MIPHINYYPPAGQVIDATDGRVQWNGHQWVLGGKPFSMPSTHRLIGRPGGPLAGWYFDFQHGAWMEPSPTPGAPAQTAPQPQHPAPQSPPPAPQFHPMAPLPLQHPPQAPAPHSTESQVPAHAPERKECHVEKKPNAIEALVKHPVAPVIGGLLLLAAHLTDEPVPPQIPDGLPDNVAKQWQMIFNQNQQRFARRMAAYENLGMVLLGYAGTGAVLEALPPRHHSA